MSNPSATDVDKMARRFIPAGTPETPPRTLRYHRTMAAAIPPNQAPEPSGPDGTLASGPGQFSAPEPCRRLHPHEIPYPTLAADTHAAAERLQLAIYRDMTPARKLQLVLEAMQLSRDLALAGLRARHPAAAPGELRRRLFGLELGEELATKVYGPLPRASGEP
jgi:hypothetical protein